MGTSLKGKNLPSEGANSLLLEQFLMVCKITYHIGCPPLSVDIFITHVHELHQCSLYISGVHRLEFQNYDVFLSLNIVFLGKQCRA